MTIPTQGPQSDAEWARNTEKRLRQLEQPRSVRIGPWVIGAPEGKLIASRAGSTLDVGTEPIEQTVVDLTRGQIINEEAVTNAVTGSPGPLQRIANFLTDKWNDLTGATASAATANTNHTNLLTKLVAGPAEVIGSIGDLVMDGVNSVGSFLSGIWDAFTGNTGSTGKTVAQVKTAAGGVTSTANTAHSNANTAIGSIANLMGQLLSGPAQVIGSIGDMLMDGVNSVGSFLNGLWGAFTGQSGSGKTVANVTTAAGGVTSTANTASTNANTANTNHSSLLGTLLSGPAAVIGSIGDVVMDGVSSVGSFLNGIWDAFTGNSGSTGRTVAQVKTAATSVTSTANTGVANAATANTNLQTTWNELYDGFSGTSGSTLKTPYNVRERGAAVRTSAITGEVNAATAIANAATADGKAVAAQGTANTGVTLSTGALMRGSNLVQNSGFEDPAYYLGGVGIREYSTEQKRTGARSLKMVTPSGSSSHVSLVTTTTSNVLIPVAGSDVWYAEVWVYGKADNAAHTSGIQLGVSAYNSAGEYISNVQTSSPVTAANNGTWTKVSGLVVMPSNTSFVYPYMMLEAGTTPGVTYYFDDVILREHTGTQNVIDNTVQGIAGGTTSGYSLTSMKTNVASVTSTANTGVANAATAQGTANTGVANAAAAHAAAMAADAKAVAAQNLLNAAASSANNLIPDPSLEDTVLDALRSQLISNQFSYDTVRKHSGARSLKHIYPGGYPGVTFTPTLNPSNTVPVVPGQVFYMSQWVFADSANTGGGWVLMFGMFTDSNGVNPTIYLVPEPINGTPARGSWVKQDGYVTVPAGYDRARFLMASARPDNTVGDVFWFDDFSAVEVTDAYLAYAKAAAAQATANTAVANAATADGKAATAQAQLTERVKAGSNLVYSPDFEDVNVPRHPYGSLDSYAYSTAQKHSGTRSLRIIYDSTAVSAGAAGVNFRIEPNTHTWRTAQGSTFYAELWCCLGASNSSTGAVALTLECSDSLGVTAASWPTVQQVSVASQTKVQWFKLSGYATVPPGLDQCVLYLWWDGATLNDELWIDDVVLREVTHSQQVIDSTVQGVAGGTSTGYTLSTLKTNVASVTSTANTGVANAATAQSTANTGVTNAATAQSTANTGVANAATAQTTANTGKALARSLAATGANLAVDGGFEDTSIPLAVVNGVRSSERAYSGTYSVKITQTGTYYGFIHPVQNGEGGSVIVPAAPDDRYNVEFMVYGDAANVASSLPIWFQCSILRTVGGATTWATPSVTSTSVTGVWTKVSGQLGPFPANTYGVEFYICTADGLPAGNKYFIDDARIYRVTEAIVADNKAVAAQATANTGVTNAGIADGKAVTADGKAVAAQGAAATADAKAVAAQRLLDATSTAGDNLIPDPLLEVTEFDQLRLNGASSHGGEWEHVAVNRSGRGRSLKVIVTTGSNQYADLRFTPTLDWNKFIPVRPGQVFYFSYWAYAAPGNTGNNHIETYMEMYNADYSAQTYMVFTGSVMLTSGGNWTKVAGYATVPNAGQAWMRVYAPGVRAQPGGNIYYFSEFELYDVTEAYNAKAAADAAHAQANTATANAATADGKAVTADGKAVAAQSVASTIAISGSNLIANSSFENSSFYQLAYYGSYSTEQARTGTQSIKLTSDGVYGAYAYITSDMTALRTIAASPGDVLKLEGWVYGKSTNTQTSGATNGLRIVVSWFDKDLNGLGAYAASISASTARNSVWSIIESFTNPAPANTAQFRVYIETTSAVTAGETYYFDDVVVQRVTEGYAAGKRADVLEMAVSAGANMIPDPGFENDTLDVQRQTCLAGGYSHSTEQKHGGSRSIKCVYGGGYPSIMLTPSLISDSLIPTTVGRTYYVSQWVYMASPNTGSRYVELFLQTWDDQFTAPGYVSIGAAIPLDTWTKMEGYLTVNDADAAWMVPLFGSVRPGNDIPSTAYFDDVVLIDVTDAWNAKVLADAAQATANTGVTNAGIADGKAVTAQTTANVAQVAALNGTNIVSNPGFESSAFINYGQTSTAQKRSGSRSLFLASASGIGTYATASLTCNESGSAKIACKPGDKFAVEFWVYGKSTNVDTATTVWVQFNVRDKDEANFSFPNVGVVAGTALNGVWTKVTGTVEFAANAAFYDAIMVVDWQCPSSNEYYFDDVTIYRITEAAAADVKAVAAQATANTGVTNAATADGKAVTADGKATTAKTVAVSAIARGDNLCTDPEFENNYVPQWGGVRTTEQARTGTQSLRIIADGGYRSDYLITDNLDVVRVPAGAGEVFYVEAWVYGKSTNVGNTGNVVVGIECQLSDGNWWWSNVNIAASTSLNGVWTKISGTLTTPALTRSVMFFVQVPNSVAVGDTYYFDNAVMRRVTESNAINQALFGQSIPAATIAQAKVENLETDLGAIQSTAESAATSAETVTSFWNTPRVLPAWMGQQGDDVAFAYSLIDGATAPAAGQLLLIPVTVQQDRSYDSIKLGLETNTMTNIYVGLYSIDQYTGAGTKVLDLGDVKSQVDLAYDRQEFAIGQTLSVQHGELYYIGVLQTGTPGQVHRWSGSNNFTMGTFPRSIGMYHSTGGQTSLPASFTNAETVFGGTVMKYWAALGNETPDVAPPDPAKVTYSDSFTRSDSSSLGASWLARYNGGLQVATNKASASKQDSGHTGFGNSYVSRLTRTDQKVGATISVWVGTTGTYTVTKTVKLGLRAPGTGTTDCPCLEVYGSRSGTSITYKARIKVFDSVKTEVTYSGDANDQSGIWYFTAVGNVYTAYFGGVQKLSWTDSTAIWSISSITTEAVIWAKTTSTQIGSTATTTIDTWYAEDL